MGADRLLARDSRVKHSLHLPSRPVTVRAVNGKSRSCHRAPSNRFPRSAASPEKMTCLVPGDAILGPRRDFSLGTYVTQLLRLVHVSKYMPSQPGLTGQIHFFDTNPKDFDARLRALGWP